MNRDIERPGVAEWSIEDDCILRSKVISGERGIAYKLHKMPQEIVSSLQQRPLPITMPLNTATTLAQVPPTTSTAQ
jgi:hypothetical protein